MKKVEMPEWTNGLPNHTKLMSQDVMSIFGYKTSSRLGAHGLDKQGYLPIPDGEFTAKHGRRPKKYWLLGSIRKKVAEIKNT